MKKIKLTLLGTADVGQIPLYGCDCLVCQRAREESRFRRLPSSALIEFDQHVILIDAGLFDLSERFPSGKLTHILLTHYHADHVQGLLHFRWGRGSCIPVIGPNDNDGFADLYKHPGMLDFSEQLKHGESITLGRLKITALKLCHSIQTNGYLFESENHIFAYLTDTRGLPEETLAILKSKKIEILIIDCTFSPLEKYPRNHNDLNMIKKITTLLDCQKIVLTHIGHDFEYWLLSSNNIADYQIGEKFFIAYDGQEFIFDD